MSYRHEDLVAAINRVAESIGRVADALEAQNTPEIVEDCEIVAIPYESREAAIEFLRKRKKAAGEWEKGAGCYGCSECGGGSLIATKYCGNCGVVMKNYEG